MEPPKKGMEYFWIEMGWYTETYNPVSRSFVRKLKPGGWADVNVRESAVRFLLDHVLHKDPRDVTVQDFRDNMLGGLLSRYHNNSPYSAVKEARYEVEPREMAKKPQRFCSDCEHKKNAAEWLSEKTGKKPEELTKMDFRSHRLGGVLDYHGGSPYRMLKEIGIVDGQHEVYMRSNWHGRKVFQTG